ncbi:MAG: hypothetical protein KJ007_08595 [Burkholderiales bacterium]|nr:hypothetical protein [Burkholderiales bacterium]
MTQSQVRKKLFEAIDKVFGSRSCVEALNSERALQCALYASLRENLPIGLTILVEPTVVDSNVPTVLGAKPDLLVVELPKDGNPTGRICLGVELKFKPWGHVVYEEDLEQLVEYRKSSFLGLKYGIKLDDATERIARFSVEQGFSKWAFIAVGQSDSVVSSASEMHKKIDEAEGILAACLVAASRRRPEVHGPSYWIGELGGGTETKHCA